MGREGKGEKLGRVGERREGRGGEERGKGRKGGGRGRIVPSLFGGWALLAITKSTEA